MTKPMKETPYQKRHARLYKPMSDSEAWRSLCPLAICVWLELNLRHNGFNNGDISLSYGEVRKLHNVGNTKVKQAFDELIERGFVVVTKEASFDWKSKQARRWRITSQPVIDKMGNSRGPETNDWRKYRAAETHEKESP